MFDILGYQINKYLFQIIFVGAIVALVILFVYNLVSGKRGSYSNFGNYIWTALENPSGLRHLVSRNDTGAAGGAVDVSRGEIECKRAIERLTGRQFTKARPDFLRNPITNSNLELDCYNEELRLAVEYNGEQHYRYVPYFHKTKDAFYNLKYRDDIKSKLCVENDVRLIIVPYTVADTDIESFIMNSLINKNIVNR